MEGVPRRVSAITVDNGMVRGLAAFAVVGAGEATFFQQDSQKEPGNCGGPVPWFDDAAGSQRRAPQSQMLGIGMPRYCALSGHPNPKVSGIGMPRHSVVGPCSAAWRHAPFTSAALCRSRS